MLVLRTVLLVMYSVVILWHVSVFARERGAFAPFLPFLLWGILVNALAAFVFYEMQFTFWWFLLDFAFFLSYALLLSTLAYFTRRIS